MTKRKPYTQQEVVELRNIQKDAKTNEALHAFAKKTKTTYEAAYARWWGERRKAAGMTPKVSEPVKQVSKTKVVTVKASKKPIAYVLEVGASVNARGDQQARIKMFQKMKHTILSMEVRKHTLPIYNADVTAMRKVLEASEFHTMSFGFTKIPGNPKMRRMYRKA